MPQLGLKSGVSGQFTPAERAIKHEYDIRTERWSRREIQVSLATSPFQEGTNRSAYMMKDLSMSLNEQDFVAKLAKNPLEERKTYFSEVEMQCKCKVLAAEYNRLNPPKKIDFVQPSVIELLQRVGPNGKHVLMMVEPYLRGVYRKYSNNYGFVSNDDRNTPHAFSHFTHQYSGGNILVCDIQGTENDGPGADVYTDPQIHSNLGPGVFQYGNGDMGIDGIRQFFATHKCNNICRMLGLSPNPSIMPPQARSDFNLKTGLASRGTSECSYAGSIGGCSIGGCSIGGCSIGGLSGCSSGSDAFARIRSTVLPMNFGGMVTSSPQVVTHSPIPAVMHTSLGTPFSGCLNPVPHPQLLIRI